MINSFTNKSGNESSLFIAVGHIINLLGVKVSERSLQEELMGNPYFPSLLAASDALFQWNVNSMFVKIPSDHLHEATMPALAKIKKERSNEFISISNISNSTVTYTSGYTGKEEKLSCQEFEQYWDGKLMLVEKSLYSKDAKYSSNKRKERNQRWNVAFATITAILFLYASFLGLDFTGKLLLMLKLTGLIVSVLLVVHDYDKANVLANKICRLGGGKSNCGIVTSSSFSKLFGWISFSELGAIYFGGGGIALSLSSFLGLYSTLNILAILTVLVLPYTFFSIFIQMKIKAWCPLCLAVQGILWMEFICYYHEGHLSETIMAGITLQPVSLLLFSYLFPLAAWLLVKQTIEPFLEINGYKRNLDIMLRDRRLFLGLVNSEPEKKIPELPVEIIVGSKKAETEVVMIISFFCSACARTIKEVFILDKMLPKVNFRIRFDLNKNPNKAIPIMKHLLGLYLCNGEEDAKTALLNWFSIKNYDTWVMANPLGAYALKKGLEIDSLINDFKEWHASTKVEHSPFFFIDGKPLPYNYTIFDIKHHLRFYVKNVVLESPA